MIREIDKFQIKSSDGDRYLYSLKSKDLEQMDYMEILSYRKSIHYVGI